GALARPEPGTDYPGGPARDGFVARPNPTTDVEFRPGGRRIDLGHPRRRDLYLGRSRGKPITARSRPAARGVRARLYVRSGSGTGHQRPAVSCRKIVGEPE